MSPFQVRERRSFEVFRHAGKKSAEFYVKRKARCFNLLTSRIHQLIKTAEESVKIIFVVSNEENTNVRNVLNFKHKHSRGNNLW